MNALCLVAHPDDCVIFALSYIHNHADYDWTIGYLTYTEQDPRGQELADFWRKRGINCVFLGFEDQLRHHKGELALFLSKRHGGLSCGLRPFCGSYDRPRLSAEGLYF